MKWTFDMNRKCRHEIHYVSVACLFSWMTNWISLFFISLEESFIVCFNTYRWTAENFFQFFIYSCEHPEFRMKEKKRTFALDSCFSHVIIYKLNEHATQIIIIFLFSWINTISSEFCFAHSSEVITMREYKVKNQAIITNILSLQKWWELYDRMNA